MKRILFSFLVLFSLNTAMAESVKIARTQNTTQEHTNGIETGDSETRHIERSNKDFSFFIGGNISGALPLYSYDLDDIYPYVYDDVSIDTDAVGYGWGIDAGIKFRKDKYDYHPVLKAFLQKFYNSGTIECENWWPSYEARFDTDVTHTIYGAIFDNYFRIAHNQPSILNGSNVNDFFTVGLGFGNIESKYENEDTNIKDEDDIFILTLGYLSQFDNGLGITLDTKYYFPHNESVDFILSFELGLKYFF